MLKYGPIIMPETAYQKKNTAAKLRNPQTDPYQYSKPEWNSVHISDNYQITVTILEQDIIWLKPSGYATLSDVKRALEYTQKIRKEIFPGNRPYVQIDDWSKLKGSSFRARQFYINDLKRRKRLRGLIYYNPSPALKVAIQLGKRFKFFPFIIENANGIKEAVSIAKKFLNAHDSVQIHEPALNLYSEMTKKNGASNVVENPDWKVDFGNFSIKYEIINKKK